MLLTPPPCKSSTPAARGPLGALGPVLLLVVAPAVQFAVLAVAGGGERLLARGALQTLLVPRRAVHPQQEAVRYGARAARTHGLRGTRTA